MILEPIHLYYIVVLHCDDSDFYDSTPEGNLIMWPDLDTAKKRARMVLESYPVNVKKVSVHRMERKQLWELTL